MNEMSRLRATPSLPPPLIDDTPDRPRLRPRHSGPFGVLDIGTSKIVCVIARVESDGSVRVLGTGWQKGQGVRAGAILDLETAERSIRAAVGQAEEEAGIRLRAVIVNLTAGQPESRLIDGQLAIGGRAVTDNDISRVYIGARNQAIAEGRSLIHSLPLAFTVDGAPGIADPRGQFCETLDARLHVIDAVTTSLRTLDACLARCDLHLAELVSAPMAAGMATLVAEERMLGTTLLDMGGGTSGLAVFAEGHLLHTAQIPVGGVHVTNDIARVLSTPNAHAERLKTLYGAATPSPDDERQLLPVPAVGEEEHQISKVPRSMVINIIQPRLEETFQMVKDQLDASGLGAAALQRVVLTGGASQLPGVRELAARMFGGSVRMGRPMTIRGMPDTASGPAFATAIGLLAWAAGEGRAFHDFDPDSDPPRGMVRRVWDFLRHRL
jgi:cell division protein FtsA